MGTTLALRQAGGCASAVEERLQEQLQTLQRKLVKAVADNETLCAALDHLHAACTLLTQQLLGAGLVPAAAAEDQQRAAARQLKCYDHGQLLMSQASASGRRTSEAADCDAADAELLALLEDCAGAGASTTMHVPPTVYNSAGGAGGRPQPAAGQAQTEDDEPQADDRQRAYSGHSPPSAAASYGLPMRQQQQQQGSGTYRQPYSCDSRSDAPALAPPAALATVLRDSASACNTSTSAERSFRGVRMGRGSGSSDVSAPAAAGELHDVASHARALQAGYDAALQERDDAVSAAVQQKQQFDKALGEAEADAAASKVRSDVCATVCWLVSWLLLSRAPGSCAPCCAQDAAWHRAHTVHALRCM